MTRSSNPAVIGTPGGGLVGATWAANEGVAAAGRRGEIATAELLDRHARSGGPVVLHDLRIPIPRISANIDHVVVAGDRVLLVDSKSWKPGRYWTVAGRTFRGFRRFTVRSRDGAPAHPAEKQTMVMAAEAIDSYLRDNCRGGFRIPTPVVVIWPTGKGRRVRTGLLTMPGARAMSASTFRRRSRRIVGDGAADPRIVAALSRLVNGLPAAHRETFHPSRPDIVAAAALPAVAVVEPVLMPGGDPYSSSSYAPRPTGPAATPPQPPMPASAAEPLPPAPYAGSWDSDDFA